MTKKEMTAESGWYYNESNTRHYVSAYRGELVKMCRCGKLTKVGWHPNPMENSKSKPKTCGRCEMLYKKDQFTTQKDDVEAGETPAPPDAESMLKDMTHGPSGEKRRMNMPRLHLNMRVLGEVTPIANVPVPDLEQVILILQSQPLNESAMLSRAVRTAVVASLQTYITDAKKRAEFPTSMAWKCPVAEESTK